MRVMGGVSVREKESERKREGRVSWRESEREIRE